jgi:Zn-dependent membrane protease YugP
MQRMPEGSAIVILFLFSPFMIIGGLVMGEMGVAGVGAIMLVVAVLRYFQIKK